MNRTIEQWIQKTPFSQEEQQLLKDAAEAIDDERSTRIAIDTAQILTEKLGLKYTAVCAYFTRVSAIDKPLDNANCEALHQELLKIKQLNIEKVNINSENFRRMLLAFCGDMRILLILMVESAVTMRYHKQFSEEENQLTFRLARHIYIPFTHRLGLYDLKIEMEEQWMKYAHPSEYLMITKLISSSEKAQTNFFRRFTAPIRKVLDEHELHYTIAHRYKSISSIWRKMKTKGVAFDEIFDLFAIRIILDIPNQEEKMYCWQVYSLVSDLYTPDPSRLRDWISVPRPSGYESLHTTVQTENDNWVEIQIRTKRMHETAEKGSAAHFNYKDKGNINSLDLLLTSIRKKLETPNRYDIEMGEMSLQSPYDDHIFVLTPHGDVHSMKKGVTVLDFAFSIHSDIGESCSGAKINDRFQSIKHPLSSGDVVEIISNKQQQPTEDWLNFVQTSKAKNGIKRALRAQATKQSEIGKELIFRKLKNWKITYSHQDLELAIRHFKQKNAMDFYHKIALEEIRVSEVRDFIQSHQKNTTDTATAQEKVYHFDATKLEEFNNDILILDQDAHNINHVFSTCCKPLPGDDVFGFVTVSKGIKIHRKSCPNAKDMRTHYGYRIIPVKWKTKTSDAAYRNTLSISGIDREGLLTEISKVASQEEGVNLVSITIHAKGGTFSGEMTIQLSKRSLLTPIIRNLKRINGVHDAQVI